MNIQENIKTIKSIGEEIIGGDSLERLLTHKQRVYAYDGFEPSGRMHIAQGLLRTHNVNKFIDSGVHFKFWVADWFALMNLKLGGDIKKIQQAGKDMILMWKACDMNLDKVDKDGNKMIEFLWSSEEINKRPDEYWKLVLDIATKFSLNRIKKCTQIMGRKEEDEIFNTILDLNDKIVDLFNNCDFEQKKKDDILGLLKKLLDTKLDELAASQIFYPVMQCADVFFLGIDIASLGMDQRKVNTLALEYCDKIKRKNKPIIISHHMLKGLDGSDKMSKSNPDNTIFMDDSETEIIRKIKKSFCEPGNIDKNPLLDWIEHLILPIKKTIVIKTKNDIGEEIDMSFDNANLIADKFKNGYIHPKCLKNAVTTVLVNTLIPIQQKYIALKKNDN
ncbi:tyrosyl-tRNA synthetase [Catovirus CTV1]|mgnify:CR=1 FL=1|uniref:tyrosine--tRNA ligase n=1 Tax=Catovirus CTV1 TaxID=1977631 RepID=A0A1V0S8W8_9VIRU|nr:tyrosyl-tRNA synthetase [Catovirus CTV1]